MAQAALPFKLEATEYLLTENAGLALFGEFARGLGFSRKLAQEIPKPGSGRGYEADAYVTALVLMLTGGGRSLEDLCTLKCDTALATALKQGSGPMRTPSTTGCTARVKVRGLPDWTVSTSALLRRGFGGAESPRTP